MRVATRSNLFTPFTLNYKKPNQNSIRRIITLWVFL
uniref:Uncharacterized protein n=1 Tax=Myoviridae sp. ctwwN25 TaxID=2825209 RepID=A0A8S5PNG1_9CAUD|nr:MAG TPA: hypothetical protein [Myoviridae sp. ctwwN25]